MAIKATGALSLTDIRAEFGGPVPASLGNYYRGGSLVPTGPVENGLIATSGAISMSQFYGAGNVFTTTFTGNFGILDLRAECVARGWNQSSPVVARFPSGTIVASTHPGYAALNIGGSFPNGIVVDIDGAAIVGCGGVGGRGGGFETNNATIVATAGGAGGPALWTNRAVTIRNNGWILGGGGGGGGGASGSVRISALSQHRLSGGGGGGGMDWNFAYGGAAGATAPYPSTAGGGGGNGTSAAGGGGGPGAAYSPEQFAGSGGGGGGWGAAGAAGLGAWGATQVTAPAAGGAGGAAVLGNQFINWTQTGTRLGALL